MAKEGNYNLTAENKEDNQINQPQKEISENSESLNFPKLEKEEKPKSESFPVNTQVNRSKTDEIKKLDSSFSDSIIFNNENLDPRGSFDYSSQMLNVQDNNYINITQYDPNLYKKKDFGFSQFDISSKSLYNPGMSTMRFISEMDLRCDDHLTRFKEDIKADRYCSECRILCCDACVIDFHIEHINSAKIRVEEYFKKQKNEMEELRSKINSAIKHKTIFSEFNLTMEILEKNISTYFLARQNYLEHLKIQIETLICEENDLCNKMKESLHVFYKDEALRRMEKPLKDLDNIHNRLQAFLRDWDTFSRSDKAKALKNNQFLEFQNEAEDLYVNIRNTVNIFKNKSKVVQKNINEILKSFSVNEKLCKIESNLEEIKKVIKSCVSHVDKINFEEINLEEFNLNSDQEKKSNLVLDQPKIITEQIKAAEPINFKKNDSDEFSLIKENKLDIPIPNYEMKIVESKPMPIMPIIKEEKKEEKFNPIYPDLDKIKGVEGNKNVNAIKDNFEKLQPVNQIPSENQMNKSLMNTNPIIEAFKLQNKPYEVMIGSKLKSDDIVLYDSQRGFITVKLNKSFFQDQSNTFTVFPENSRCVNLGFSLLITGGYMLKEKSKNCYLLVASKNDDYYNTSKIPYDISIMSYSNMIEARERHNLIYLPEMNSVLAACGFYTQSAEVCDLNTATWKPYPKLNEMRANGTIAYVNKRYVWIFSGFRLNETKQQGIYSNTFEMLDLKSVNNGWTLFNFDSLKISMKLCAMGVINLSNNSILLCGGFDGNRYQTNVYKVDFNEGFNVQQLNTQLPGNMIFLHNNFIRLNEAVYNYDLNMSAVYFDPIEFSFKVRK